jgi:hypothetical protein
MERARRCALHHRRGSGQCRTGGQTPRCAGQGHKGRCPDVRQGACEEVRKEARKEAGEEARQKTDPQVFEIRRRKEGSGLPNAIADWVQGHQLSFWTVMTGYLVLILALGTILDSGSIVLISVPLALPIFNGFGTDIIWLGVVTVIAVEVGLLTPPLGVACFVVKANLQEQGITLNDVFSGAFPFVVAMTFTLILVTAFPQLALFFVR